MIKAILKDKDVWYNLGDLKEYIDNHTTKKIPTDLIEDSEVESCEIYFTIKYIEGTLSIGIDRVEVEFILQEEYSRNTYRFNLVLDEEAEWERAVELDFDDDYSAYRKDYLRVSIFPKIIDIDFKHKIYTTTFNIK